MRLTLQGSVRLHDFRLAVSDNVNARYRSNEFLKNHVCERIHLTPFNTFCNAKRLFLPQHNGLSVPCQQPQALYRGVVARRWYAVEVCRIVRIQKVLRCFVKRTVFVRQV